MSSDAILAQDVQDVIYDIKKVNAILGSVAQCLRDKNKINGLGAENCALVLEEVINDYRVLYTTLTNVKNILS